MTLADRFSARHNNFDLLRLLLAGIVVLAHGIAMRTGDQPRFGISTIGDFAVDGFFILSGFLVTRSWLSLNDFWRYTWHRFLRIMPGYWVCLVVMAVVVAPAATLLGRQWLGELVTAPDSVGRFLLVNSGLMVFQYDIASVFASNPTPLTVNGALWTLILEAGCYFVLACFGLAGLLRGRRRVIVPVFAAALGVLAGLYDLGIYVGIGDNTLRMLMLFMLGASAHLFADRIPMNSVLAAVAAVVLVTSIVTLDNYRHAGAYALAYLLLWLAAGLRATVRLKVDLSYGVYIYHYPLQQLMMLTALAATPTPLFVLISLVLVLPIAASSWFAVERPCLRRKNAHLPRWLPGRMALRGNEVT